MYSVGIVASRMWFVQRYMKSHQLIQKFVGITWQNGDVFSLSYIKEAHVEHCILKFHRVNKLSLLHLR
jgi:hypothetical protein